MPLLHDWVRCMEEFPWPLSQNFFKSKFFCMEMECFGAFLELVWFWDPKTVCMYIQHYHVWDVIVEVCGGSKNSRGGSKNCGEWTLIYKKNDKCKKVTVGLGPNYKKILRLSYDVIITYDNRKLLSHRKIIVRFSCNQAPVLQVCASKDDNTVYVLF